MSNSQTEPNWFEQQLEECRSEVRLEMRVKQLEAQMLTLMEQQPEPLDWHGFSNSVNTTLEQLLSESLEPLIKRMTQLETENQKLRNAIAQALTRKQNPQSNPKPPL